MKMDFTLNYALLLFYIFFLPRMAFALLFGMTLWNCSFVRMRF